MNINLKIELCVKTKQNTFRDNLYLKKNEYIKNSL